VVSEQPPGDPAPKHDHEFDDFFRKEYLRIVRIVMYSGATFEEADEAVSQAMAQAYFSWPLLTNPPAWVSKVALNVHLKQSNKDRRRRTAEERATRLDCLDRGSPGPQEEPDEYERVIALLKRLPAGQRQVMALTFEGYSPMEIAEQLHQKPGTVRSHLRHARDRLCKLLNQAADENVVGDEKEEW